MKHSHKLPLLGVALAGALALAGCERAGDERSVGQRVDGAVERAGDTARDATITTKVNAALAADDRLKATRIDVDTQAGRVTLSGNAPDPESRDRATVLAQAVEGVVAVENKLTVKGNG